MRNNNVRTNIGFWQRLCQLSCSTLRMTAELQLIRFGILTGNILISLPKRASYSVDKKNVYHNNFVCHCGWSCLNTVSHPPSRFREISSPFNTNSDIISSLALIPSLFSFFNYYSTPPLIRNESHKPSPEGFEQTVTVLETHWVSNWTIDFRQANPEPSEIVASSCAQRACGQRI